MLPIPTANNIAGGFLGIPAHINLQELHRQNRLRLCEKLRKNFIVGTQSVMSTTTTTTTQPRFAVFQGGSAALRFDTDHELLFRQESNFALLFGVKEPECFAALDIDTGASVLFIPELSLDYAIVMGTFFHVIYWC